MDTVFFHNNSFTLHLNKTDEVEQLDNKYLPKYLEKLFQDTMNSFPNLLVTERYFVKLLTYTLLGYIKQAQVLETDSWVFGLDAKGTNRTRMLAWVANESLPSVIANSCMFAYLHLPFIKDEAIITYKDALEQTIHDGDFKKYNVKAKQNLQSFQISFIEIIKEFQESYKDFLNSWIAKKPSAKHIKISWFDFSLKKKEKYAMDCLKSVINFLLANHHNILIWTVQVKLSAL